MPYKSDAQRRAVWAKRREAAKKKAEEEKALAKKGELVKYTKLKKKD
jgi:hypothetical protein